MLHVICWKWQHPTYRTKFTAHHVNVLAAMLRRTYSQEYRLICVTDDPEGIECETFPLWKDCGKLTNPSGAHLPSCYRRLRIFSSAATSEMGIADGERVVSIDLDVVILKDIHPMVMQHRRAPFAGWKGVGSYHAVTYNGTFFMFDAGRMKWLWDEFDPETSPRRANVARYFGSDQGWMSYKLAGGAPGWTRDDGIYSFSSHIVGHYRQPPENARIVSFNGKQKPWDPEIQKKHPWLLDHWRL